MKIPEGYQAVMPYLFIKNGLQFIDFTRDVFNAELLLCIMRDDNNIRHAEIRINGCTIMFSDSTDEYPYSEASLMIYVDKADETFKNAIKEGASVVRDLSDQEYGRTGGVRDKSGVTWWITSIN